VGSGTPSKRHLRAYRVLLLALPRRLRRRHGDEMEALFDVMWHEQREAVGASWTVFWLGACADIWREATQSRMHRGGGRHTHSKLPGWRLIMDLLRADLRFAITQLRRNPGFAAVAVLTLALGIGATTAVFSVADAVVLRPLPYPESGRLVRLYETDPTAGESRDTFAGAVYLDWRAMSASFEELAAFRILQQTLTGSDAPRRISMVSVTPEFFAVFGVEAQLGRVLSSALDQPGGDSVAVISHAMWQRDFSGDQEVLGERLVLNGEPYSIVGVLPPTFDYPHRYDAAIEVWTAAHFRVPDPPIYLGPDPAENRGAGYLSAVARLADGVSVAAAQAEMTLVAEQIAREYPDESGGEGVNVMPLQRSISGDARPLLLALLAAVGLVMLIACSNVANLMLARSAQRRREIAMRVALGASRGRVVSQLLTESLVLAGAAGVIGVGLARFGIDALLTIAPDWLPGADTAALDLRVLSFSLVTVLGAGIIFGLAPTFSVVRPDLQNAIQGSGSIASRRGQRRIGRALIIAEVSMSLLLVLGAGLMARTFLTLSSVEPGFDPTDTLVAHVSLPDSKYAENHQIVAMFNRVVGTLQETPGIESAGSVLTLPMHWNLRGTLLVNIEGKWADEEEDTLGGYQLVTPGYFRTLRIPLVRGRFFEATDTADAPSVAIINEAFAAKYFAGEEPVGQRVTWDDPDGEEVDWATIIGIVRDIRLEGLDAAAVPETYLPYAQATMPYTTFVVRSSLDSEQLAGIVRQAVLDADPEQPITGVATMEDVLRDSLGDRRFNMQLLGGFAVAALFMAAIGLYGVLSFSVAQRTREIGLRRALGAQQTGVVRLVVTEGLRLVAIGMALGVAGAFVLGRFIASQLYGVEPTDPLTVVTAVAVIATVALLATCAPAIRAARTDPMTALRR